MKALWNSFGTDEKPQWLSLDRIEDYSKKMAVKRPLWNNLLLLSLNIWKNKSG